MGCGGSKDGDGRRGRKAGNDQNKEVVLIYGMPDGQQTMFQKAMEKCFAIGGLNQSPYLFVPVATDRASRGTWTKVIENYPKLVACFFLADLSSPSACLLSVKVANWMRSQLAPNLKQPMIIGCARTQNDKANFAVLQEHMPHGIHASIFNDQTQSDIQRCVDFIASKPKKGG